MELLNSKGESELNSPLQGIDVPEQRTLTFGEKLVGINFNPSNDDTVSKAKRLCAELADLLQNEMIKQEQNEMIKQEISIMKEKLFDHAVCQILDAQMNVVKVLTLKY